MTLRSDLAAQLKPVLPKAWKIIPYAANLDAQKGIVVLFSQTAVQNLEQAPSFLSHTFSIFIIDPRTDPSTVEDSLDDSVGEVLWALKGLPFLVFDRADRVTFDNSQAWEIHITVLSQNPKEVTP